ncbi:MAG: hypothetical protein AB9866_13235 [Syntrophobacteraceae bacterium]
MGRAAIRIIFFVLVVHMALIGHARANYDHYEDLRKAQIIVSEEERGSYVGKTYRALFGQRGNTPPLKFCDEPDSFKSCYGIYREELLTVIDYVIPSDFKILFLDSRKIAFINTNEFVWGLKCSMPDRTLFEVVQKAKKSVVKKAKRKRVVKKVRCCCCCCTPCCCGQRAYRTPCKPCVEKRQPPQNPCKPCEEKRQ